MQYISSAFAIAFLVYVFLIIIAGSPIAKIDRMCDPIFDWPKRALVALAKVGSPSSVQSIERSFANGHGSCRNFMWEFLFEEEYRKAKAAAAAQEEAARKSSGDKGK